MTIQKQIKQTLLPALLVGAVAAAPSLFADDAADTIKDLRRYVEELDQKVRVLERKTELDKEIATEKARTTASVTAGPSGFSIRSADTKMEIIKSSVAQVTERADQSSTSNS